MLRRDAKALADEPNAWRIVGSPRAQKGKVEVLGCSDSGRVPLRLLRRNRAPANRELERADRGDVMLVDAAQGDERVEIEETTTVTRRNPTRS